MPADLLITGARVQTMDDAGTTAEAIAITGNRISAIGSARDVAATAGPRTRVIELRGVTVLPGFQDAHVHPLIGGEAMILCELHDLPWDRAAYLGRIAAYAAANPDVEWIRGGGWGMPAFENGTPNRHDLDAVTGGRPALLDNRDGHGAWANSAALARAGITAATADPADGRIEREKDGTPQGTLHEGAVRLVKDLLPPFSQQDWERALLAAQGYLQSFGITGVCDAWVERHHVAPYRAIAADGRLTLRTKLALWWERGGDLAQLPWFEEARATTTVGRLRPTAIKLMLDGVPENGTAAMLEPYFDAAGTRTANRGLPFIDPERLAREFAPALDAAGFQLHFHAIGDAAVRAGLDAVEATRAANGPSARRPHIAHLQVVHPADIPRFAALGVGANMQPFWACHDQQMDDLTIPFLGPERAAQQYPFASLERAGARLVGGSDWSVSTPNVMAEIEVAVRRRAVDDREAPPFLPDEALTLESALRAFTRGGAWANDLDGAGGAGWLGEGRLADLAILDRDIFDSGAGPIGDALVTHTLIGGEIVFERGA